MKLLSTDDEYAYCVFIKCCKTFQEFKLSCRKSTPRAYNLNNIGVTFSVRNLIPKSTLFPVSIFQLTEYTFICISVHQFFRYVSIFCL